MIKLKQLADFLILEMRKDLLAANHKATGNLIASLDAKVYEIVNGYKIEGGFLYYGRFVNTGRKAGVKRVPISVLIDWIRQKRITFAGKTETQAAFMIQTSIFKKGIPTDGDPKKIRFVDRVLENNAALIEKTVNDFLEKTIELQVTNFVKKGI